MSYLMSFDYLIKTESETIEISNNNLSGWFNNYAAFIDCLFKVVYYVGEEKDVESNEGQYMAYAHNQILKLPYTIRATSILLKKGFYLESALLVRHILEVFVQLRFFSKYKERVNNYVLKKEKITLKTMFNEFNPELYSTMYWGLSEAAHGGFGSTVYRTKYKSSSDGVVMMGSIYDELFSNYLLNQLIPLIYGIVNFIPIFFKQYLNLVPQIIESNRASVLKVLKEMMNTPPKSEEFLKDIKPLIENEPI